MQFQPSKISLPQLREIVQNVKFESNAFRAMREHLDELTRHFMAIMINASEALKADGFAIYNHIKKLYDEMDTNIHTEEKFEGYKMRLTFLIDDMINTLIKFNIEDRNIGDIIIDGD